MTSGRTVRLFRSRAARFEAVVRPHLDRLFGFAMRMTRDSTRAEDLVQSLLLKLYPQLETLEALDKAGPWLARALHNLYVDELRATRRNPLDQTEPDDSLLESWPAPASQAPDAAVEQLFEAQRLEQALAALSPAHRAVVAWHDIEGYTLECRLPVNSVHCKLEVSGHTTAQEASDAQEQVFREPDRQHAEAGGGRSLRQGGLP